MTEPDEQFHPSVIERIDANGKAVWSAEVTKPGGVLRFAVGEPGRHGMVWRLWSNPSTSDLYLGYRLPGQQNWWKWSFHQTGDWRFAHEPFHAGLWGIPRIIDQWRRPEPNARGFVPVIIIHTPAEEIHGVETPSDPNKIEWIAGPRPGKALAVHVLLAPPNHRWTEQADSALVGFVALADGWLAVLYRHEYPMTEEGRARINQARQQIVSPSAVAGESYFARFGLNDGPEINRRITMHTHHQESGQREIVDFWLHPTLSSGE